MSTPELATNLPMAFVPDSRPTLPMLLEPEGIEGREVTSTSPISTPEFAASLPIALEPVGSDVANEV